MVTGIEHFAIASPNPRQLAEWYVAHLQFQINYDYNGNYFVRAPNGFMIEIVPSQGEAGPNEKRTPGMRHIAISVDDFDQAYAELQRQGVPFTDQPYENEGNRLVFFADPDGNQLHLIQRPRPLP
jgi:catechol 2,3-dioxygenase-like lactoylglutathione lyase family enzyme